MFLGFLILLQAGSIQHVQELRVDENQISGDWFSLQFENDSALMLFQLREQDIRVSSSRTSILPLVSEKSFG
jgi:hypothetical protein